MKSKAIGLLFIFYAILCFLNNFGIWKIFLLGDIAVLWNPLSLLTPGIIGGVPIVGGGLGWLLNYVWAVFWSLGFFLFGGFLLIH